MVSGYVLHDFAKADKAWLEPLIDAVAKEIGLMVKGEDARFATRIAHLLNPPQPRPPKPPRDTTPPKEPS